MKDEPTERVGGPAPRAPAPMARHRRGRGLGHGTEGGTLGVCPSRAFSAAGQSVHADETGVQGLDGSGDDAEVGTA